MPEPGAPPPEGAPRSATWKRPLERHALTLATLSYVLGWTAHTAFVFYLAPIALRLAGHTDKDAWVFAGTAVASILTVLPSGRLTDRFPRRRVLRVSMLLLALAYVPVLAAPPGFAPILMATLLTGTGFALMFVSFNAYVPDLLATRAMSSAYARSSAFSTLAGAGGPFVGAIVFGVVAGELTGARTNAALFLLVGMLGALATLPLPPVGHAYGHALRPSGLADAWRTERPHVVPAVVVNGFLGAGYGATLPYFAVFFLDVVRVGNEPWGYVLAVATLASALGSLLAGRLAGRLHPRLLVLGPQALLTIASLAFLLPLPALALAAVFVTRNLFSTTTGPMVNTMLMPRVQPQARGRVQAWSSLAWNVGWALGAAVGGLLLARLSGALFPIGAAFGAAGVAFGIARIPREAPRDASLEQNAASQR